MLEKFVLPEYLRAVSICPTQYYTSVSPSSHHGLFLLITACAAWALESALLRSVLWLCGHISQWSSDCSFPLMTLSLTHWLSIPAEFAVLKTVQNQCAEFEGTWRQVGGHQWRTSSEPRGTHSEELSSFITSESQRVASETWKPHTAHVSLSPSLAFFKD